MSITRKQAEELGIVKKGEKAIKTPVLLRGTPVKMMHLHLPYPPTDNHYYTIFNNRKVPSSQAKKYWKDVSQECTLQEAQHVVGRITLEFWIYRDNKVQFDIGNLVKAVQDSLTKAGVYADDRFIDHLLVHRGPVKPNPHIVVHLEGEMPGSVDLFANQEAK